MLNKSYSYLVPLVNEHCKIDSDYLLLLRNTYVRSADYPDEDVFVIEYEFVDNDAFLAYIDGFRTNELFREIWIDKECISIILYFPKEYLKEYNMYKTGKYSKFPNKSKELILKYILNIHNMKDAARVRAVLYKDEALRKDLEDKLGMHIDEDLELSSKPNLVNETFVKIDG